MLINLIKKNNAISLQMTFAYITPFICQIYSAGIGTFPSGRLPQLHRASPSAALDDVFSVVLCFLYAQYLIQLYNT
jgi:hypothetical protein